MAAGCAAPVASTSGVCGSRCAGDCVGAGPSSRPAALASWPGQQQQLLLRRKGGCGACARLVAGGSARLRRERGGSPVQCAVSLLSASTQSVGVEVERTPNNSRRLFASVAIDAPRHVVWGALTDYDSLDRFIPGLEQNRCLERRANGARLLQVGAQELAMGMRFCARVVLDIHEFRDGLPPSMASWAHHEQKYPQPRAGRQLGAAAAAAVAADIADIAFSMVEGDFQAFQGVWRLTATGPAQTCLSYALFVRPQLWLPVQLIQSRIEGEVANNLRAVRQHTERLHRAGAGGPSLQ